MLRFLVFWLWALAFLFQAVFLIGCRPVETGGATTLVLTGGSGPEESFARRQLEAFQRLHPDIRVTYQATPSSASERHTLYVTWLSSGSPDIDVLNLDVIWVPEFAAAGWLKPLDAQVAESRLDLADFLPAGLLVSRYQGSLHALPWYVDAGLLYYRRDLYQEAGLPPPRTFTQLLQVTSIKEKFGLPYGFLFQGKAYEGLVCVVLEMFWGRGGRLFDENGQVVLDSPKNREALQFLVDLIYRQGAAPLAVTTFLEEDCRHAFQQGYAACMRNWPYAYALMNQPGSKVRGKFGVLPPLAAPGEKPTAVLGGGALGISAFSRHPEAAWKLVRFLLTPENLQKRALALGMLPPLKSLYDAPELRARLPYLADLKEVFFTARPRPVTPLYSFISDILRIHFSRALTRQETVEQALGRGQAEIVAVLGRFGQGGGRP